jgi:hypothetical protein
MDLAHDIGAGAVQDLGAILLPAVILGDIEVHGLHAAAHGAIAQQDALTKLVEKFAHWIGS